MAFARKIWKLLVGIKDALALLFLLLFFGLLYAVLAMRPSSARVEQGALLLDLDGRVVEEKSKLDPLQSSAFGQRRRPANFRPAILSAALRLAARDDRIKVVVLDLSSFHGRRLCAHA